MYYQGEGIAQDKVKAVYWFTKVAEQGLVDAQHNLAIMYGKGDDIKQDKIKAVYWCTKAAEQGYPNAQYNLMKEME